MLLYSATAERFLGPHGRNLHLFHESRHPEHEVHRCMIVNTDKSNYWWGDVDLTLDGENLRALSAHLGKTLYVLPWEEGRKDKADLSTAVFTT